MNSEKHPASRSHSGDIARRAGVSREAIDAIFAAILAEVALGRAVVIEGFGRFRPGQTSKRRFKTPIIGEVAMEPRRCIRFNQARGASKHLNG
jgi:nucleoid DNA-binding protein